MKKSRKKHIPEGLKDFMLWVWFIIFIVLHFILLPFSAAYPVAKKSALIIVGIWWGLTISFGVITGFIDRRNQKKIRERTVVINDELGVFSIDPVKDDCFSGTINWLDSEECYVHLERDSSDEATAVKTLKILHKLCGNMPEWDRRLKEYSAENAEVNEDKMIEIWGSGNETEEECIITKEEYISRMSLGIIHISTDGDILFLFELDGMFTDHAMAIRANISGEISDEGLWG